MDLTCNRCGTALAPDELYDHNGKNLCEDCFLESQTVVRTCDPWAVYTASRTADRNPVLTGPQEQMLDLIKSQGPMPAPVLCQRLGMASQEFERSFTPLRHMELLRAYPQDGQIFIALFKA